MKVKRLYQKLVLSLIKLIGIVICLLITLFLVFITNGFVEYNIVQDEISEFKARGSWVCDIDNYHFYEIDKAYDYEDTSIRTYSYKYYSKRYADDNFIGDKGDIIITSRNPMRDTPIGWIIGMFSKYYYVGHSTITTSDYKYCYESEGKEDGGVHLTTNNWMFIDDCPTLLALRVKTTEEIKDKALEYVESKEGFDYNWSFVFNRNRSYYCTDLISRAYKQSGVDINYDKLATTGNDMILSDNTYIYFYKERYLVDGAYEYNVYYLKDDLA